MGSNGISGFLALPLGLKARILEKTEDAGVYEFTVPGTCPYFDGHFPEYRILPAVAQFDLIWACGIDLVKGSFRRVHEDSAKENFNKPDFFPGDIRRIKFNRIITPGTELRLELKLDRRKKSLRFLLYSPEDNRSCSTGTIHFEEKR
jgi:3-hydroxymyristoyl/3-hydroxydecanoyl-(acyl carrier protein) dehydratase